MENETVITDSNPLKRNYYTIWMFMLASVPLYMGVAWMLNVDNEPGRGAGVIFVVLAVAAVILFCTSLYLGHIAFSKEKLSAMDRAGVAGHTISQSAFRLMTMLEAVSILGMVSRFMGYSFASGIPFYAAAATGLVLHRMQVDKAWRYIEHNVSK